jgi:type III restriction enzyme
MQLKFDADQEYQRRAIDAVSDLFEGQPGRDAGITTYGQDSLTSLALTEVGIANRCVLSPDQWLANLRAVQEREGLESSEKLEGLLDQKGKPVGDFPNFSVEMETGTGKTYVYLRTIHELHQTFGFCKFVIVVPSVAIREGVLKTLRITRSHFRELYSAERVGFDVYESARVGQLRNFALSDALQILVINIDSFAKDADPASGQKFKGNVINQLRESGIRPIQFIQETCPVVILDEPQNLETDKRKQAIARLNPMCTLRYSATHRSSRTTWSTVWTRSRAWTQGLVKQISVDSVVDESSVNQAFVELESFTSTSRSVSAKATIWVNTASGPRKKRLSLKPGDDLYQKSREREIYRENFIVNEIDAEQGLLRFANDVVVRSRRAAWRGWRTDRAHADRSDRPSPFREGPQARTHGHQGAQRVSLLIECQATASTTKMAPPRWGRSPVVRGHLPSLPGDGRIRGRHADAGRRGRTQRLFRARQAGAEFPF